jgi:DNA-binding transcriptional regulator YiaG
MTLAKKLYAWRQKQELTQQQAATKIGAPIGTYRDWEQGRSEPRGLSRKALLDAIAAS